MLGMEICDPDNIEGGGAVRGMELLAVSTVLKPEKTRSQTTSNFRDIKGLLSRISGMKVSGYEIHMGQTKAVGEVDSLLECDGYYFGNVYGSYLHGIFDHEGIAPAIVKILAEKKGITIEDNVTSHHDFKESQYDLLADTVRKYIDMEAVYKMLNEAAF